MNREKRNLRRWYRLEGYSFHERPLERSLVDCLEEETGHSKEVCYTLIEEYRRFMYLVSCTDETLSPSPVVLMVWRMHMADRQAYFEDFCPRIIGRTALPPNDPPPLRDDPAYVRTLHDYTQEFGLARIQYWPDPDVSIERISHVIMTGVGIAAFGYAMVFGSFVFAVFGMFAIASLVAMQWQISSLPLRNPNAEMQE